MTNDTALTPEQLEAFAHCASKIRVDLFCSEHAGVPPIAEQHIVLALDALSQAMAHLKLAKYHYMRKE